MSFPKKNPPNALTAAAVITPSGAAPIPYSKSTFPSAASIPAETSPSDIKIGVEPKSLTSFISLSCLCLSRITIFKSSGFFLKPHK